MAGNQSPTRMCVCLHFCIQNRLKKKKFRKTLHTVVFSNPVCPLPRGQDSSSLHYTTGCFCRITRMLLTYMEILCENKTLLFPPCPLYAPVCAWVYVCMSVHAWARVCVFFFFFCPLRALRFCVQRELLALMFPRCRQLLIPLLACTELMQATRVLPPPPFPPAPPKHFQFILTQSGAR